MNLEDVVCSCFNITNGMIKDAVDSGATTFEEVQEITGVGTACGICIDDVQRVVDYFATERSQ
ncbi:MAG: (2Fe-2S)-binding protein [Lachnospiraceae bacterium]|nr:(2Fe-2S)-binding protein [Lachnospiraceae bacterium]